MAEAKEITTATPKPKLLGLSLAAFDAVTTAAGGSEVLNGLSTDVLKAHHVLNHTSRKGSCVAPCADGCKAPFFKHTKVCSDVDGSCGRAYVDLLRETGGSSFVGDANVFVSHVYDYPYLDVVGALRSWQHRQPADSGPFYYYFDLFVVNQHGGVNVSFEELRDTFAGGVLSAGRTVLVLDEHASAMQRLWCVFEILTTIENRVALEVAMAPDHAAAFRVQLLHDCGSVVRRTMSVDSAKARAFKPSDEANIRRVIESRTGYLETSKIVVGAMKDWMVAEGRAALAEMTDSAERATSVLWGNLASILFEHGKLDEAEPMFRAALSARRLKFGSYKPETISVITNLSILLKYRRHFEEAESLAREAVSLNTIALGPFDESTLVCRSNLAQVLRAAGKLVEAEPIYREVFETSHRILGPQHHDTIINMVNLAEMLRDLMKLHEAEPLYHEALKECLANRALGPEHPVTVSTFNNLAGLLSNLGKLDEAESLYRKSLELLVRAEGSDHYKTIITKINLGSVVRQRGRLDEAETHFSQALTLSTRALGKHHDVTQRCLRNLDQLRKARGLPSAWPIEDRINSFSSWLLSTEFGAPFQTTTGATGSARSSALSSSSCVVCGRPPPTGEAVQRCSICKGPVYCGRVCQRADWGLHKKVCRGR